MTVRTFDDVVLAVGTKKGLFLFLSTKERARWRMSGPFLNGNEINHAVVDPRTGTVYATVVSPWFGAQVSYSKDLGKTWHDAKGSPAFAADSGLKLERLWHIEPGRPFEPGVLYCGVAPAALFRSEDGGSNWEEMRDLTNHPTRPKWFPGAGGLMVHSIVLDPADQNRMWVGISAAGVFRTDDGGKSWCAMNSNLRNVLAKYVPEAEMYPEAGQCVHHLTRACGSKVRLYAQTHWGTYRSDEGAQSWTEITEGLPSDFGFVMAAHPREPNTAFVVPLQGAEFRCPPGAKLRVFRTGNAGKSWEPLSKGLPQRNAYMGTYREGMAIDELEPAGLYLGTNTGHLYASVDEGESWRQLSADLPPIFSASVTVFG